MIPELQQIKHAPARIIGVVVACLGIATVYLFQRTDVLLSAFSITATEEIRFVVNKVLRVALNDLLMLWLIHAWFGDKNITRLAFWIQLFDTLILLPLYLVLKLSIEGPGEISSPVLSQLHRLIVNPTLLVLLIPGVYLQRLTKNS